MSDLSQIPADALPDFPEFIRILNDRLRRLSGGSTAATKQQSAVIVTTHEMRIAGRPRASDDPGSLLFESNRNVAYASAQWGAAGRQWIYTAGMMVDAWTKRPADLGKFDVGFQFYAKDYMHLYRWDGAAWLIVSGEMRGVLAALPALTSSDIGFFYVATDYLRKFRWAGSVWERAAGELPALAVSEFMIAPASGWALCDGSLVTYSTDTGGVASFALPNLIGAYVKGGNAYSGAVNPIATTLSASSTDWAPSGVGIAAHSSASTFTDTGTATATTSTTHAVSEPNGGLGHQHPISALTFTVLDPTNVVMLPYAKL